MKVYVSKYAHTIGIVAVEATVFKSSGAVYPHNGQKVSSLCLLKMGSSAHKNYEDAAAAANAMITRKITSLRKQIKKLEAAMLSVTKEEQ
ncbi:MAG: hypothetical protein RL758_172 [Pseudomonadota bacterium]|jgi:hypothetical protein